MFARWRLFRLLGIPISLDASWLIILALLTWTLMAYFREAAADLPEAVYWLMGLGAALAFFICILLHELGHAVVARAVGIPIRGITLFLFGGVAEMEDEPPSALSEFLMASAGPAVSAVLVVVFWLATGWVDSPVLFFPLQYLAIINLVVLIFNLVPAFPLDGGRVLRSILWGVTKNLRQATFWAALCGQAFSWLLMGLAILNLFAGDTGHIVQGIWLGLIAFYLNSAARGSYEQIVIRQALRGEKIGRFMNPEPIVVPPSVDLKSWVDDYVYRYHHTMYPVAANGHVEGVIATQELGKYPQAEWPIHTVGEAMRHDVERLSIPVGADALDALGQMQRSGSGRLLVTDGAKLVGIVSLKDLLRFLDLKIELERRES